MKSPLFLFALLASIFIFGTSSCDWQLFDSNDCGSPYSGAALEFSYYNEFDTGPSISSFAVSNGDITYNTPRAELRNDTVQIVVPGIRVQSDRHNYEITAFRIEESDGIESCFKTQSEFNQQNSNFKTDIAAVLVLDMSASLSSEVDQLKSYAKDFAQTIVDSSDGSKVAIVFFSSQLSIQTTDFFTRENIDDLKTRIDNFTDYQDRTALYYATAVGISMLDTLEFNGARSLVAFTDGGDNDSDNPSNLIAYIQRLGISVFSIGLNGEDFDQPKLERIATNGIEPVIANDISDLEDVFKRVGRGIISVYEVVYNRSAQLLSFEEEIDIRFSFEIERID